MRITMGAGYCSKKGALLKDYDVDGSLATPKNCSLLIILFSPFCFCFKKVFYFVFHFRNILRNGDYYVCVLHQDDKFN